MQEEELYEVGKGKPPMHTRFQKGNKGGGRKKASKLIQKMHEWAATGGDEQIMAFLSGIVTGEVSTKPAERLDAVKLIMSYLIGRPGQYEPEAIEGIDHSVKIEIIAKSAPNTHEPPLTD